ncbi:MAG: ORF6N domain-containing protein, partial [bacterium]
QKHRDPNSRPFAFTEHGAIMAANVLNSRRAVEASVFVVRAFVGLRHALTANHHLARKLVELERRVGGHDGAIRELVAAIRRLAEPPPAPPGRRIGFHRDSEGS